MAAVQDIGVDLGTSSVVIYGKNKGIILDEPAVIAFDRESRTILAVGEDAYGMIGRTPSSIVASRPLKTGAVKDSEMASAMLRYFTAKVAGKHLLGGPRVVFSTPEGINETERVNLAGSFFEAGARKVQYMERPLAAALGAGLPIMDAYGQMVCDIGGNDAEIAVTSLGQMTIRKTSRVGGDAFDDAIIKYIRRKHNLLIGEVTAEKLKKHIGSVIPRSERFYMKVTGRNLISGLPKVMSIYSDEITEAMDEPLQLLLEDINDALEHTPTELVTDVFESGICLTGGGACISGLCDAVSTYLKVDCHLAENPQECVARGCGLVLENWAEYGRLVNNRHHRGG